MIFWNASRLFLLSVFLTVTYNNHMVVNAQAGALCTDFDAKISEYTECILQNAATCTNCEAGIAQDTNSGGGGGNGDIFLDCNELDVAFCPIVRCCSACEEKARTALECYSTILSMLSPTIATCDLGCSDFAIGDQVNDDPCVQEAANWASCLINNPESTCGTCYVNDADFTTDECQAFEDFYCPVVECCEECGGELFLLLQCSAEADTNADCTLDCNGFEIPPDTITGSNGGAGVGGAGDGTEEDDVEDGAFGPSSLHLLTVAASSTLLVLGASSA